MLFPLHCGCGQILCSYTEISLFGLKVMTQLLPCDTNGPEVPLGANFEVETK